MPKLVDGSALDPALMETMEARRAEMEESGQAGFGANRFIQPLIGILIAELEEIAA